MGAKTWKVYLITAPDGKQYVGCTCVFLRKRFQQHVSRAEGGVKSTLSQSIREFGEMSFRVKVLREFSNEEDALQFESFSVKKRKTWYPHGLNSTKSGQAVGHTDNCVKNNSEAHIGHVTSNETKKLLSKIGKGRPQSEEHVERRRQARLKYFEHPANRAKQGEHLRKARMARGSQKGELNNFFDKRHTAETRELIRQSKWRLKFNLIRWAYDIAG